MSESAAETVLRDVLEELGCGTVTLFQIRCLKVYFDSMELTFFGDRALAELAAGFARQRLMADVWAVTLDVAHGHALEFGTDADETARAALRRRGAAFLLPVGRRLAGRLAHL